MARPGDIVVLPGGDERVVFHTTARETDGRLLEMEATYAPGGRRPPDHFHPRQEERFECLAGSMNVRLDGDERTLSPGDTLTVPAGTRHSFWNGGGDEACLHWEVRPALRTEEMFERLGHASSTLRALGAIAHHGDEFRLARPPWPLQRPLLALIRLLTPQRH